MNLDINLHYLRQIVVRMVRCLFSMNQFWHTWNCKVAKQLLKVGRKKKKRKRKKSYLIFDKYDFVIVGTRMPQSLGVLPQRGGGVILIVNGWIPNH